MERKEIALRYAIYVLKKAKGQYVADTNDFVNTCMFKYEAIDILEDLLFTLLSDNKEIASK